MKLKSAILAMTLLAMGAGAANAGQWYIGGTGGAGIPTGDYSNAAATGWNAAATVTNVLNDQWGIGADLGYHSWNASKDAQDALELALGAGTKAKTSAVQATAHAMYRFPTTSNAKPYAQVGAGLYNLAAEISDSPTASANTSNSWSKLGFNVGAGMNFATSSNMMWGMNGTYHIIPAKNDFGSDVNMFTVGLNVMWGVSNK